MTVLILPDAFFRAEVLQQEVTSAQDIPGETFSLSLVEFVWKGTGSDHLCQYTV